MNTTATTRPRPLLWPFFAWAAAGAGACVAVLSALSTGVFVTPLVIAATAALLRWPRSRTSAALGAVSGLGLVLLYVAGLNRGGPGEVCSTIPGGQTCVTQWSPWPWFGAGIALFTLGITAFTLSRSRISR
jgi:hypothetical protein